VITLFFALATLLTLGVARADARRHGVHPWRRLTDEELSQP
jgi:hypothetical protein